MATMCPASGCGQLRRAVPTRHLLHLSCQMLRPFAGTLQLGDVSWFQSKRATPGLPDVSKRLNLRHEVRSPSLRESIDCPARRGFARELLGNNP